MNKWKRKIINSITFDQGVSQGPDETNLKILNQEMAKCKQRYEQEKQKEKNKFAKMFAWTEQILWRISLTH